jgi:hypothetical protein
MSETVETEFLKITRDEFDKVLRVGTPEFLQRLPKLTVEELQRGERWINELRARKTKNTYMVFPVSTPKQQAAGKLYFYAMNDFRKAVRNELADRAMADIFGNTAEQPVAA